MLFISYINLKNTVLAPHLIITMNQSYEQDQQCFIPARRDEQILSLKNSFDREAHLPIVYVLPSANQILDKEIPTELIARTCFLELGMRELPIQVEMGNEIGSECKGTGNEIAQNCIRNEEMRSIKQFFKSSEYKTVYNRISKYFSLNFASEEMMNRFKNISLYQQYNRKLFAPLKPSLTQPIYPSFENDYFDSNFECGNLGKVYMKSRGVSREYFLLLENDVNSHAYTSWFFFKVMNCGVGTVKFHIINLVKTPLMFRNGLKISIFSMNKWKQTNTGWFKGGQNITTFQNNFPKEFKPHSFYSTLYFQYEFAQPTDHVYFAMSRPYSYTRLINYIGRIQNNQQLNQIQVSLEKNFENNPVQESQSLQYEVVKKVMSICYNVIPIIEIWKGKNDRNQRKAIILMGRQHPAQIVGSFIMEQLMNLFTNSNKTDSNVEALLSNYLIVLIPMVNPDGVIHGNSRCNLSGLDLNRNWMETSPKGITPQTMNLRKYIWDLHECQGVQYLIDLHGHSKKIGSFMFCNKRSSSNCGVEISFILSKLQQRFDFKSCTFNKTADKKNTLRNQLLESGMKNCLTFQNSYFGYRNKQNKNITYTTIDFYNLALSLIKALAYPLFQQQNCSVANYQKFGINRQSIMGAYDQLQRQENNRMRSTKMKMSEELDLQSDSQPQQGILKPEQASQLFVRAEEQKKSQTKRAFTSEKKKVRIKKNKQQINKKLQQTTGNQIRQSHPLKEKYKGHSNEKMHKSEKKIITRIPSKPSIKSGNKKQETNKFQSKAIFEKKIPTHQLTINQSSGKINKSRNFVSVFTNYPVNETTVQKLRNKQTQFNKTAYGEIKLKKERKDSTQIFNDKEMKNYLNETLSILRINALNPQQSKDNVNEKREAIIKKNHKQIIVGKISSCQKRVKTEGQHLYMGSQQSEKKKVLSRNYRKQILKRKKMLTQKEQSFKFKRFQNYLENASRRKSFQGVKLDSNSVFYHFPIL